MEKEIEVGLAVEDGVEEAKVAAVGESTGEVPNKGVPKWVKIVLPLVTLLVILGIVVGNRWGSKETADFSWAEVTSETLQELPLEVTKIDLSVMTSFGVPVIIDFGSESCQPCRDMAAALEEIQESYAGRAIVTFSDVWAHQGAATGFPVSVIPTQFFYNADGTPYVPSEEIAQELGFTIYTAGDGSEHIYTAHQGGLTVDQMERILEEMGVR